MLTFINLHNTIKLGKYLDSLLDVLPDEIPDVSQFRIYEKPIDIDVWHKIFVGRLYHLTKIGSDHVGLKETLDAIKLRKGSMIYSSFFNVDEQKYCVLFENQNYLNTDWLVVGMFSWKHNK